MRILGIDTILHDTCVSIVENGNKVLVNNTRHLILRSHRLLDLSVAHLKNLGPLIKSSLKEANCKMEDISLIAVNNFGSLLSGVEVAVSAGNLLSSLYNIPIIPVHHQEAHIFSNWLERDLNEFNFPIVVFSASGGHSSIAIIEDNSFRLKLAHKIKGMEKRENSDMPNFRGVGAIYAHIAHSLRLGERINSGHLISEVAKGGDCKAYNFSSLKKSKTDNFNFSDLEEEIDKIILEKRKVSKGVLDKKFVSDIAASFESSITDKIIDRLAEATTRHRAKEVHLVGGISANDYFREKIDRMAKRNNLISRYPKQKEYCTDNAAMVACLGYYRYKRNSKKYSRQRSVGIISNLKLEHFAVSQYLDNNEELC